MVLRLAYVEFASPEAAAWEPFAELLGAAPAAGDDGVVVRLDERPWRVAVRPGEADRLLAIGWDIAADGFGALEDRLAEQGLTLQRDDHLAADRHAEHAAWTLDPWGYRHEFVAGVAESAPPESIDGRFITGEQGMGHLVLMVPDAHAAHRFVTEGLGMRLSDTVEVGSGIRFYHCAGSASRHHSIAFSEVPGMRGLHHIMFEVADIDDVGLALDRVRAAGHDLAMDYGRHPNDLMTSFYVRTPSGFELEYGAGGVVIDDATWEVASYDVTSIWGHHPPDGRPLRPGVIERLPEPQGS